MLKYLFSLLFACNIFAQLPTETEINLIWDENSEPELAGYRVKAGPANGFYNKIVEIGLPAPQETCEGWRIYGTIEGLTVGEWYARIVSYDHDGEEFDYSGELTAKIRPVEFYYSNNNTDWILDKKTLIAFADSILECQPPRDPVLTTGGGDKYYKYVYLDEETDIFVTEPIISEPGIYLQWNTPDPDEEVISTSILKKVGGEWVFLPDTVLAPKASFRVTEAGEYAVVSVNIRGYHSEPSNSIVVTIENPNPDVPLALTNLRIKL